MAAPNSTTQIERRESQFSFSTRPPVKHKTWDEARNLWKFKTQGRIVVWCQKAANWLVLPPALFFHFFLKRKWWYFNLMIPISFNNITVYHTHNFDVKAIGEWHSVQSLLIWYTMIIGRLIYSFLHLSGVYCVEYLSICFVLLDLFG